MPSHFTPSHRGGSGPPLVCLHGFTDTWRTWELVLPELERHHDVLAPTLAGHAGGPPLEGEVTRTLLADAIERAMDDAGFGTAHIVGNSLGGYVALQLAARGRAESVVALAPGGGWAAGDESYKETLDFFVVLQQQVKAIAPRAAELLASPQGRRRATQFTTVNYEHIPAELLVHQTHAVAACEGVVPMSAYVKREGYELDAARITCPVRVVWGTEDKVLAWPSSAVRYRDDWLPRADWVVLDGVGHCPQLDVPLETAQLIVDFIAGGPHVQGGGGGPTSMASGPETDVKMLATGLAAGILIDATIIRALIVPAAISLMGRWNWWLPRWSARLLRVEPSPA